jgi:hypothetical protein
MYKIMHNPFLNTEAGYVSIDEKPYGSTPDFLGRTDVREKDRNTLLYFLFWVTYTYEGRQICRENQSGLAGRKREGVIYRDFKNPNNEMKNGGTAYQLDDKKNPGGKKPEAEQPLFYTDDVIRTNLTEEFQKIIKDPILMNSLVEAKIAAGHWTNVEHNVNPANEDEAKALEVEKAKWASIYQHHMSFIMWTLWENFQDHEFSVDW